VNASACAVLARHRLLARRDLGQNFLVDDAMATRLVELAGVGPGETVIEIGAGLGTLTQALAARAARVVAIEVDAGLVRALRAERLLPDNVELLHADALSVDLAALAGGPARVIGNLPYSVASPLLRRLLDLRGNLLDWSVMLQREVAARVGGGGTRD
jgi:16S rRNA (adenine1518-N6/adenine1519-N6)-dimethyltransferase